ncbi:aminoacyl-tRNA synthetase, partial [Burkholderia cenocepacia]
LLHDFLSPLEAILSSFNWSENSRAGQYGFERGSDD